MQRPPRRLLQLQLHLEVGDCSLGRVTISNGSVQGPLGVQLVQRGEKLPLSDACALVEEDARDAPGDLRRHGRTPARSDVTAGVEQCFCFGAARRAGSGNLHDRHLAPQGENASGEHHQHSQGRGKNAPELSSSAP